MLTQAPAKKLDPSPDDNTSDAEARGSFFIETEAPITVEDSNIALDDMKDVATASRVGQLATSSSADPIVIDDEDEISSAGGQGAQWNCQHLKSTGLDTKAGITSIPKDGSLVGPKPMAQDIANGPSKLRHPPPSASLADVASSPSSESKSQKTSPTPDALTPDTDVSSPFVEGTENASERGPDAPTNGELSRSGQNLKRLREDAKETDEASGPKRARQEVNEELADFSSVSGRGGCER